MRYAILLTLTLGTAVAAQQPAAEPPRPLTTADYARAERFMTYNTTPLVLHSGVRPAWLPDDRFWYRTTTENGDEAVLVDAPRASRGSCDLPACRERRADSAGGGRGSQRTDAPSPDGTRTAFI